MQQFWAKTVAVPIHGEVTRRSDAHIVKMYVYLYEPSDSDAKVQTFDYLNSIDICMKENVI